MSFGCFDGFPVFSCPASETQPSKLSAHRSVSISASRDIGIPLPPPESTRQGFSPGRGHNTLLAFQFSALHLAASDMTKDQSLPAANHLSHLLSPRTPSVPPVAFHSDEHMSHPPFCVLVSNLCVVSAFQLPVLIHTSHTSRKAFLGIVGKQVPHSSGGTIILLC